MPAWLDAFDSAASRAPPFSLPPPPLLAPPLDRLLERLLDRRDDLLRVLDRPDIPLHTNGSENDIRCHVTKRKISGGTRSEAGRDARDAFLGLLKTCQKLGVPFFDYLGQRLDVQGAHGVPPLPDLVIAAKA